MNKKISECVLKNNGGVNKMSTSLDFIQYICEQLNGIGVVTYKKMFGEYMVYLNSKPVITVCDNIAFVKKLDNIAEMMKNADVGFPYKGAKEHYVLDFEDADFCKKVLMKVEEVTPIPKRKKK